MVQKDTCTPVFTAAIFTTAKTWKQPTCTLTEGWIKKMWHTHTTEYYSATKKNEIAPSAATRLDPEMITLSEISQTEKQRSHMISLICGI